MAWPIRRVFRLVRGDRDRLAAGTPCCTTTRRWAGRGEGCTQRALEEEATTTGRTLRVHWGDTGPRRLVIQATQDAPVTCMGCCGTLPDGRARCLCACSAPQFWWVLTTLILLALPLLVWQFKNMGWNAHYQSERAWKGLRVGGVSCGAARADTPRLRFHAHVLANLTSLFGPEGECSCTPPRRPGSLSLLPPLSFACCAVLARARAVLSPRSVVHRGGLLHLSHAHLHLRGQPPKPSRSWSLQSSGTAAVLRHHPTRPSCLRVHLPGHTRPQPLDHPPSPRSLLPTAHCKPHTGTHRQRPSWLALSQTLT